MDTLDLLAKLQNIALGLGQPQYFGSYEMYQGNDIYKDEKISIHMSDSNIYHVYLLASPSREEVFCYRIDRVEIFRAGNWLNYIESLQQEAIEGIRLRRQEAIEREFRRKAKADAYEAAKFAPINDSDIFGS